MIVKQESLLYKPITIELEKQSEAKAFFDLIYKLESYYANDGETFDYTDITPEQRELIVKLCNERSENLSI